MKASDMGFRKSGHQGVGLSEAEEEGAVQAHESDCAGAPEPEAFARGVLGGLVHALASWEVVERRGHRGVQLPPDKPMAERVRRPNSSRSSERTRASSGTSIRLSIS